MSGYLHKIDVYINSPVSTLEDDAKQTLQRERERSAFGFLQGENEVADLPGYAKKIAKCFPHLTWCQC